MTASCDQLIDLLRDGNLLTPEQYAHMVRELAPMFRDPERLAAHLVKVGWITNYQLERLNGDHWRELFLGDYYLWDSIGEGGMGEVFRAKNVIDRREVAMKVICADRMEDETALKRFHREAKMAAKLNHPNIVRLIETGQDGQRHYIVMEYVDGRDLQWIVDNEGSLPVEVACEYVQQIADALQHAHSQNMVHRDIKPSNVLIAGRGNGKRGTAKLLDLGLARKQLQVEQSETPESSSQTALTRHGAVIGTADYMAPEQAINSSSVDHRADVYGLGCTLYYLLAGKPVFHEGSPLEKLLKHQMDEPVNIRHHRPDVTSELSRLIHQSLAKKPENRIQSCAEFSKGLLRMRDALDASKEAGTHENRSVPTLLMPAVAAGQSLQTDAPPLAEGHPSSRRRTTLIAVVAAFAALVVVAALVIK